MEYEYPWTEDDEMAAGWHQIDLENQQMDEEAWAKFSKEHAKSVPPPNKDWMEDKL